MDRITQRLTSEGYRIIGTPVQNKLGLVMDIVRNIHGYEDRCRAVAYENRIEVYATATELSTTLHMR